MPDLDLIIERLDEARRGLNEARNVAEEWRRGRVAGVTHTSGQKNGLKTVFVSGIEAGKQGIAAVEAELQG
jgi:hypothetical protein